MTGEPDVFDEVTPELVRHVETALAEDKVDEVRALLAELSATGQASVLEQLAEPEREKLVGILKRDLDPEALIELDEEVLEDVLDKLDSKDIAAAARELETDDAASILEELPEEGKGPAILLVHGDMDEVIPVDAMTIAREQLAQAGLPVEWHVAHGLGHGIDPTGLKLGGDFLRQAFAAAARPA